MDQGEDLSAQRLCNWEKRIIYDSECEAEVLPGPTPSVPMALDWDDNNIIYDDAECAAPDQRVGVRKRLLSVMKAENSRRRVNIADVLNVSMDDVYLAKQERTVRQKVGRQGIGHAPPAMALSFIP